MIDSYLNELITWNKAHNLVSKNEINNLQEHIEDSLSLCEHIKNYDCIIDIGSGGGFPVIPLAIWAKKNHPNIQFVATDIVEKKLSFLKWCGAKFDLNLDVQNLTKNIVFNQEGLIISRAFSSIKNILSWRDKHAPNCQDFCLLKGNTVNEELLEAQIQSYELIKNPRGFITKFRETPPEC